MDIDWRLVKGDVTLLLPTNTDEPGYTSLDIIGTGADGAATVILANPSDALDGVPGTRMKSSSTQLSYVLMSFIFSYPSRREKCFLPTSILRNDLRSYIQRD